MHVEYQICGLSSQHHNLSLPPRDLTPIDTVSRCRGHIVEGRRGCAPGGRDLTCRIDTHSLWTQLSGAQGAERPGRPHVEGKSPTSVSLSRALYRNMRARG